MSQTALILGAGQAGGYAAIALREAGFAGRILLLGEESEPPYERPPLSKEALTGDGPPAPRYFHPAAKYAEREITLLLGQRAEGIDLAAGRVHAGGTALGYDLLLLATGGRGRALRLPGGERAHLMRSLGDAIALRPLLAPGRHVVCVGAGVIGLEVAASARKLGCVVTVLEAAPRAMARSLAPDVSAWLAGLHRRHGVALHFGVAVDAISPTHVHCADGTRIPADVVVAGVGMERNTALAEAAGIACDNGVLVDARGRASAAGVFAAGDVAAGVNARYGRVLRLENWRHAMNHGICVARNMAGLETPYDDIPWFWTDQHGANLQVAGMAEGAVRQVWRGTPEQDAFCLFELDADGCVLAATGVNAPRDVRAAQELIRLAKPVDAAMLAAPVTNLQKLVGELRRQ